ncbi:MAG: Holliday junction branch migration protein RuvA [Oscillospiraceae bacterium]|nr:Holliday junction branch migration protein RuvA [Oscillospiraceae bacterium]
MFYYVNGTVAYIEPYLAVIDCGGVGYACKTTQYTLSRLKAGEQAKLYTYLHVREELFELYGFATQQELQCFQMLLGVSGVGPKAALAILSSVTPEGLTAAIVTENEKALTGAPGVGKRIAQRIILELKDKLSKGQLYETAGESFQGGNPALPEDKTGEAAAALGVLGYGPAEISQALKGISVEQLPLEEIIKQALKKMVK